MKVLLLIGLMGMVFQAQADVYRCQDASGKTVYQEDPCEKANLTTVKKIAKPVGEPSPEAIEKAQAESREFIQRYYERQKVKQEATKKANEPPPADQPVELKAGDQ